MTQDEIIEMARQAGGYTPEKYPDEWRLDADDLERFAKLVAQHEREACAKVAEEFLTSGRSPLGQSVANAIQERK